jgi:hypothetical protein
VSAGPLQHTGGRSFHGASGHSLTGVATRCAACPSSPGSPLASPGVSLASGLPDIAVFVDGQTESLSRTGTARGEPVTRRGKLPPVGDMSLVRRIGGPRLKAVAGARAAAAAPMESAPGVGPAGARACVGVCVYGRTPPRGPILATGTPGRVADSGSLSAARFSLESLLQSGEASAVRLAGCSGERRLAIWLVHGDDSDVKHAFMLRNGTGELAEMTGVKRMPREVKSLVAEETWRLQPTRETNELRSNRPLPAGRERERDGNTQTAGDSAVTSECTVVTGKGSPGPSLPESIPCLDSGKGRKKQTKTGWGQKRDGANDCRAAMISMAHEGGGDPS